MAISPTNKKPENKERKSTNISEYRIGLFNELLELDPYLS